MDVAHSPTGGLFPQLPLRVPDALGEKAINIRQRAVAVDEETEAFAVGLARPFPRPLFAARYVWVEPDASESLPATVRASLNVASILVFAAETDATVRAVIVFHLRRSQSASATIGTRLADIIVEGRPCRGRRAPLRFPRGKGGFK